MGFHDLRIFSRIPLTPAIAVGLCLVAAPVFGAASGAGDISWGFMAMQLFGGLALFLFGMEQMCSALKAVAGNRMRAILEGLTNNRVVGLLTGLGLTSVIQSSSVTTVMLVGFVSAGLMSLSQSIGVILGADIGTTITAQIIAFKVTKYALLLIGIGFIPIFIAKSDEARQYGTLVMGLGMIFLGMFVMTTAMKPLRTYEAFLELMQDVANPAIGILIATLFTALIQSSSAAMGVILALALQGLITLEAGIALALGANIGTCITAGLAAIGKPREAVRVAVAHVTFKVLGVLLIVLFIPPFADLVRAISPAEPGLTGLDRLAAETPRQIANAHTLFNVGIALLFLPLTTQFARFCEWVVPDRPVSVEEPVAELKPKYLDETLLSTAPLALSNVRLEIGRLGERVQLMFDKIFSAALSGDEQELQAVVEMDEDVDSLHGHIVMFLGKLSMTKLSAREADELMDLIQAVNYLEHIGDIIQNNMKTLGMRRIEERIVVSERTMRILKKYHEQVAKALDDTVKAVANDDAEAAVRVRAMRKDIAHLTKDVARHEIERLMAHEPNRLKTYIREVEIIEHMDQIFEICRDVARIETPELPALEPEEVS